MSRNRPLFNAFLTLLVLGGAVAQSTHGHDDFHTRERQVMPFDLTATRHVFERTAAGGAQRVVAQNANDARNIALIRSHLKKEAAQFAKGDFGDPAYLHGEDMAGLKTLSSAAKAGTLTVHFASLPGGASLTYRAANSRVKAALHAWFEAQVRDHGANSTLK